MGGIVAGAAVLSMTSACFGQVSSPPAPVAPIVIEHSGQISQIFGKLLVLIAPLALLALWYFDIIRPGSFARRGIREVSAWPAWVWAVGAAIMLFANTAGFGAAAAVMQQLAPTPPSADKATLTIEQRAGAGIGGALAAAAIGIALFVTMRRRTPGPPESSGLAIAPVPAAVGIGLLGIALAFPVVQLSSLIAQALTQLLAGHTPEPIGHETLRIIEQQRGTAASWAMAASAAIGAPIVEELMFRVYVQTALLRLIGRTWPAIFITAALFALIHIGGGVTEWHVLIPLFTLGAAMGLAYERSRNVIVPIVMHAVFNIVNLLMMVGG